MTTTYFSRSTTTWEKAILKESDPYTSTVLDESNYFLYEDCKALKQIKVSTQISIATQKYVAISFANNSVSYCSDLWIAGKGFTV